MELEDRVRKVENTLSFMRGALIVGLAAIVIFMGVTSYMQIPDQVSKEIEKKIGADAQEKIQSALNKANEFLTSDAHNIWPEGHYCIISNGKCPKGFTKTEGYMRAISLYPKKDLNFYIKESTPRLGDLFIKCHGKCRQYGNWTGELYVSTCCK